MHKQIKLLLVIFIACVFLQSPQVAGQFDPDPVMEDPYEPDGDPCELSPSILFGQTIRRSMPVPQDADWFQFYGEAGMNIEIQAGTDDPSLNPRYIFGVDITLFAPGYCDGNQQLLSYDGEGTGYLYTRKICIQLPTTGIYYIMLTCPTLHLHFSPRPGEPPSFPMPHGEYWVSLNHYYIDGSEPDDDPSQATLISPGRCCEARAIAPMYQLGDWFQGPMPPGYSDQDYYVFEGHAGEVYTAEVRTADPYDDPDLILFLLQMQGGTWTVLDYADDVNEKVSPSLTFTLPTDGSYYLLVQPSNKSGPMNQTSTGPYTLCLYGAPEARMDSDRNVGFAPLLVNFWDKSAGGANQWQWWFAFGSHGGDGAQGVGPRSFYEYWFTGPHHVKLQIDNPNGSDELLYWPNGCPFVEVYGPCGYAPLQLLEHDQDHPSQPWENAIDGDTHGANGMATVKPSAYATFEFVDGRSKHLEKVRLMVDGNVGWENRWLKAFRVFTSEDGAIWQEQINKQDINWVDTPQCGWIEESFTANVHARYIKLIADAPASGWVQIGEFEVYEYIQVPDPVNCAIQAASVHRADGVDAATITCTLKDASGNPVTGYDGHDIHFYCMGEASATYQFTPVQEISPGVYMTKLTCTKEGAKKIVAVAHGAVVGYALDQGAYCTVTFVGKRYDYKMKVITASASHAKQPWERAVDGITEGWEGTATVTGDPPYAVFAFADQSVFYVNKFGIKTNNGVAGLKPSVALREARRIRIEAATEGYDDDDFTRVLEVNIKNGDMTYFTLPNIIAARYIRLTILQPDWLQWRQIVEFSVEVDLPKSADMASLQQPAENVVQAYPNPFNAITKLRYRLQERALVSIRIYNLRGQEIATLFDGYQEAGEHTTVWDAGQAPSGVYVYRVSINDQTQVGRLLVLK